MVLLSNEPRWAEIRPDAAGFRLQYLEVFNWGTFHRQIWRVAPVGGTALLTGANGSGKSTLVDALLTLLVPSQRRSYNLASGSEKARERDERSYVLGAWRKQKDLENHGSKAQYLRQPGTHSVLLASFANGSTNQAVTVAQVLWIEETVRKLFVVAPLPLSIENHFRFQGSPTELRKQLKAYGAEVFNEFAAYSRRFRQLMGFRSEKALDLFRFRPPCSGREARVLSNVTVCVKTNTRCGCASSLANWRHAIVCPATTSAFPVRTWRAWISAGSSALSPGIR